MEGLQEHKKLQDLLEKVEKRMQEQDAEDAAVSMRKILEYVTAQYVREFDQEWKDATLFDTINGLKRSGLLSEETAGLFHKIRMTANQGGAHLDEGKLSLSNLREYYRQLLEFLPDFLREIPSPSEKKFEDFSLSLPDLSLNELIDTLPDLWIEKERTYLWNLKQLRPWHPFDKASTMEEEIRDRQYMSDTTFWLPEFADEGDFIIKRDGKLYIDRVNIVEVVTTRIQDLFEKEIDPMTGATAWNGVYIPGIVQEYFGFSRIYLQTTVAEIPGGRGRTRVIKEIRKDPIEGLRIIYELGAIQKVVHIPNCVTEISYNSIWKKEIWNDVEEVHLPASLSLHMKDFSWINVFPEAHFISEPGCPIQVSNHTVRTAEGSRILFQVPKAFRGRWPKFEPKPDIPEPAAPKPAAPKPPRPHVPDKTYQFKKAVKIKENAGLGPNAWGINFNEIREMEDQGASITELIIPEGVTHFRLPDPLKNVRKIHFPSTLTKILLCACKGCPLEEVHIPAGVTHITSGAFEGCLLEEVYIPDGVTHVMSGAFEGCQYLRKIRLPDTIVELSPIAFQHCTALEEVEAPERLWCKFKDYPNVKFTPTAPCETTAPPQEPQPQKPQPQKPQPVPTQPREKKPSLFRELKDAVIPILKKRM